MPNPGPVHRQGYEAYAGPQGRRQGALNAEERLRLRRAFYGTTGKDEVHKHGFPGEVREGERPSLLIDEGTQVVGRGNPRSLSRRLSRSIYGRGIRPCGSKRRREGRRGCLRGPGADARRQGSRFSFAQQPAAPTRSRVMMEEKGFADSIGPWKENAPDEF